MCLVYGKWVISYANEWEDHPKNWEPPIPQSFDGKGVLAPLGISFSLQIEDQGLVEFDLSS